MQEEMRDDEDWLWHDAYDNDDPYLPGESHQHTHYIYLDTTAPEVLMHFSLLAWSGNCYLQFISKALIVVLIQYSP